MKGYRVSGFLANGEPVNTEIPHYAEMTQEPGILSFQYEIDGEKVTRWFHLEHFAFMQITENADVVGEG